MKKKFPYQEISFRASGWMLLFYLGVIKYIKQHYDIHNIHLSGSSGGAVCMCSLLFKEYINIDECFKNIIQVYESQSSILLCSYKAHQLIDMFINDDYICPYLLNNNTITVSCSEKGQSKFTTCLYYGLQHLCNVRHVLKGATLIPYLCSFKGYPFMHMNLFDSYLTNPHPHVTTHCLKITYTHTCVCGCNKVDHVIKPDMHLPDQWCLTPPIHILYDLYQHGYDQAMMFFESNPPLYIPNFNDYV